MQTENENLLTIAEAANECPKRTSANALWRWARRGLRARTGERIHLRHVRVGGTVMIPRAALGEFFQALADADREYFSAENYFKPSTPSPAKPKRGRRSAHEQAVAALKARGL